MVVDGGISRSSSETAPLTLGNVLEGTGVSISLAKTEIDAIDEITGAAASVSDKVGGFDITMNEVAGVHEFDTFKHLVGDHENSFEREATAAFVELVLEGGAEKVHDHQVVAVLGPEVVHLGESGSVL